MIQNQSEAVAEEVQSQSQQSNRGLISLQQVNKLRNLIKDLPFLLLSIDAVWWVLSFFGIWSVDYWWFGEIFSHSIAFTAFMAFYAYVHRYCLYSWVCINALGLVNMLNILHYFFNFTYLNIYAGLIIIPCLIFAAIKWNQQRSSKAS